MVLHYLDCLSLFMQYITLRGHYFLIKLREKITEKQIENTLCLKKGDKNINTHNLE